MIVQGTKRRDDEGELHAETVETPTRSLECVDDVEGGDGLALGVFGVGYRVTNDVLRGKRLGKEPTDKQTTR